MKNRKMYAKITIDGRGKKKVYLGKQWGNLKKLDSNTECIKTGDGLWVLDIDSKELKTLPKKLRKLLPKQPTVETANGYHYYFTGEGIPQTQALFEKVDVRNEGGLVFSKYRGKDERISYKKLGEAVTPSKKLMKYLKDAGDKQTTRNKKTMNLNYVEGKKWKKFDDGEQHNLLMATMVKMFNARKTEAEVWSRAKEYQEKFLSGKGYSDRHESMLMKNRFDWAVKQIASEKIQGKKLKVKKPKKAKKLKSSAKWRKKVLKKGEFDADAEKRTNELTYISSFAKHHSTVVYGASGTYKTSVMTRELVDVLERDKSLEVFMYSFDASDLHNRAVYRYAKQKKVADRFHILTDRTGQDVSDFVEAIEEEGADLSNIIVLIDTYKALAGNVNDKAVNVKVLNELKKLTRHMCTVLTIAHSNKDGVRESGTAELEQDSDAILRFDAVEDNDGAIITISKGGRVRYHFDDVSFHVPKCDSYDEVIFSLKKLKKAVDTERIKKKNDRVNKDDDNIVRVLEVMIAKGSMIEADLVSFTGLTRQKIRGVMDRNEATLWNKDEESGRYTIVKAGVKIHYPDIQLKEK